MVNDTFISLTKSDTTLDGLKPGLEYLINALGDKHAMFRSADDFSMVAYYTGPQDPNDPREPQFVNQVINNPNAAFSYKLIADDVGYLNVVSIGPDKTIKEHADIIRAGLSDLYKQKAKYWILDLRYNGGGNMNPMLSGLAPLLGEGPFGGAADANGETIREYVIKQSQFYDSDNLVCEMTDLPKIDSKSKLVVLLSRYTISSGEIVAVAFKGRENTLFLGEPTAGYTTGNGYEQVTDNLFMMISESVLKDRNGVIYDRKVDVDIPMVFSPEDKTDEQIEAAIKWLKS